MTTKIKGLKQSRLMQEMLATAKDMHDIGIMDDASYRKVTMRDINKAEAATLAPLTGDEIRALREDARIVRPSLQNISTSRLATSRNSNAAQSIRAVPHSRCSMSSGAKVSKRSSKNRP